MSRYRLEITPQQESILLRHCSDARYVWNLCVEQEREWRPGRGKMPRFAERCRQLTEARAENPWLAEGSVTVQQQAVRDHQQAMANFFAGTHNRPAWRKAGHDEGFRIVAVKPGDVRRLNRHHAAVKIPKAGWVRFRWSRPVPDGVKSFRVTRDRAGRWHVAFAVIPSPVPGPGTGAVVGLDRGVAVSAALSTGEMLHCPGLTGREARRLRGAERKLAKAKRGSRRRRKAKAAAARLKAREADRRKDWAEKATTDLARRFDVIRVEDLDVKNMTRSARGTAEQPGRNVAQGRPQRLNRGIGIALRTLGLLVRRPAGTRPLEGCKQVPPAFTSQRCSACGHIAPESRESQAAFRCVACGFACNADVNAARNIAAGHAVKARGGDRVAGPVNREPQLALLA